VTESSSTANKPENKPSPKGSRRIPILLFITAGLPVIFAFLMYFTDTLVPEGRNNRGSLILPTLAVEKLALQLEQAGEGSVEGKWELLVFGRNGCVSKNCQEMLHNTRQVNVALGREAGRLARRYINVDDALTAPTLAEFKINYPRLHLSQSTVAALQVFLDKELDARQVVERNFIFIADPLGNVMMYYTPENLGGDILNDLKKLLKVSNIG